MWSFGVPNAPCGVESCSWQWAFHHIVCVPNAPCGVESPSGQFWHKVSKFVPNAPCGVESLYSDMIYKPFEVEFLMHRVELKELWLGLALAF